MITIEVENVYSKICGALEPAHIDNLDLILSHYVNGYAFTKAYQKGYFDSKKKKWIKWDGKNHLLNKVLKFQSGLLHYVTDYLVKNKIQFSIKDIRTQPKLGKEIALTSNSYTPRDYQLKAVDAALKYKTGIIKAATGSGKSFIISLIISKTNIPSMIYVIGKDLLYQMYNEIKKTLQIDCGIIGDGLCDIKKINVATVQTVSRAFGTEYNPFDDEDLSSDEKHISCEYNNDIINAVKNSELFVFDEAQFLGAKSLQIIAQSSTNAVYRLGASGTPWRDSGDDILLEAATGKTIIDISASALIKKGVLVRPKIFFIPIPELGGMSGKKYSEVYNTCVVNSDSRNKIIIDAIIKLYEKKRKILVLVKRKKHGIKLKELLPEYMNAQYIDGDSDDERKNIKDMIYSNSTNIIISTNIFDQGFDLPPLDALVLAGSGKSSTRALQRIGRVLRLSYSTNKKDAIVVDFVDSEKYLYDHSRRRFDIYKTEEEFDVRFL